MGYGSIGLYQGKVLLTHRVIWMAEYGEIEEGKFVCHNCDCPPCNNIKHLRVDTPAGNAADMAFKGRHHDCQGENSSRALLTEVRVSHIKYFLQQGWSCVQLAERYGVTTIPQIKRGEVWKHVQPFQPISGEPLPVPPSIKPTTPTLRRF
jgi:hypothetical protein